MFPLDFKTIRAIKAGKTYSTMYGPDPHDNRWGWAISLSDTDEILFDTGFVYSSTILIEDDITSFVNTAHSMPVHIFPNTKKS